MRKSTVLKNLGKSLLAVVLFSQISQVSAQNELSDSDIKERLQVINQMLERGKSNTTLWWTGYLIGYSAATLGQGAISFTTDNRITREDMALGAATTGLGVLGQIIAPMTPTSAPKRLASIPEGTAEERMFKLTEAEKLLQACALREKEGRSWQTHAITGITNLSSGLVVWLGFKRTIWEGVGNFALNTLITEVQIWTQPTRAIDDYNDYVSRYQSGEKPSGQTRYKKYWSLNVVPGGIGIQIQF